jgi:hypothetical protein
MRTAYREDVWKGVGGYPTEFVVETESADLALSVVDQEVVQELEGESGGWPTLRCRIHACLKQLEVECLGTGTCAGAHPEVMYSGPVDYHHDPVA